MIKDWIRRWVRKEPCSECGGAGYITYLYTMRRHDEDLGDYDLEEQLTKTVRCWLCDGKGVQL